MAIRRTTLAASAGLFALLVLSTHAFAHANLVSSVPADGAIVMVAPTELGLQFSEPPELALTIIVLSSAGRQVSTGAIATDPSDDARLRVSVKGQLANGVYEVDWRTVAKDGHASRGTFGFTLTGE